MSYLERTFAWFLKNRIFGGFQKLKQKEYLPFVTIIFTVMIINTVLSLLYNLQIFLYVEIIYSLFIMELFLSFGFILSGIVVGKTKNIFLYYFFAFLILISFIFISIYFKWNYTHLSFGYIKLAYFLIWVLISSVSLFFLTLYFFTSFPKKILTLGMPKDHIFFGYIIKIVIFISLPIYIIIMYRFSLGALIFGFFGILNSIVILILIKRAPKKVETKPGIANFATAIGFFNIFMFYHLILSFSSTTVSITSLLTDLVWLLIIVLFLVQSFTQKISESPERLKSQEVGVTFHSRMYFTDRLKKAFGERGLVLIVMGLALGYHVAILDSFFEITLPILPAFFTPNLKLIAIYHRIYLLFSIFIILVSIIAFKASKRFKEFMVDKYTITQVLNYISAYFTKTEGGTSPFELGVQVVGKKITDGIKKVTDKWQDSIDKMLKPKTDDKNKLNNQ